MISNCDDVRGIFPWLLNGTLNEEERRQVLQHLSTCETCRQDLADTRLAAEIFDQHPPAEAILALAWDETPRGIDPAFLEEHLASCPRCATELELARTSRRRLEEDERIFPLTRRTTPAPATTTGWRGWKSAALAAGLASVVASAGWIQTAGRVQTLEERLAERTVAPAPVAPAPVPSKAGENPQADAQKRIDQLEAELNQTRQQAETLSQQVEQIVQGAPSARAPQVVSQVFQIDSGVDVARGATDTPVPEITARESAVLLLTPTHQETENHLDHAVEIVNAAGKVAWKATGLQRDPVNGLYPLILPSGALPAGSYKIRVFGVTSGKPEPLESYSIQVR